VEDEKKTEVFAVEATEVIKPFDPADFGYTAYEKREYKQVIYQLEYKQAWIDLAVSFYRSAEALIQGVVKGHLYRDIEGVTGVFLFRHFLELILKEIVLWGRMLEAEDRNAVWEQVKRVANVHNLGQLWKWVLEDAKPKMKQEVWDSFDIGFAEKMIAEFDTVDPKGFSFRYHGQGGEHCGFSYEVFLEEMDHTRQVLEAILSYLRETHGRNADWEDIMRNEVGDVFGQ
jgi:hypothetical protein